MEPFLASRELLLLLDLCGAAIRPVAIAGVARNTSRRDAGLSAVQAATESSVTRRIGIVWQQQRTLWVMVVVSCSNTRRRIQL